jgi:hypothetical protein
VQPELEMEMMRRGNGYGVLYNLLNRPASSRYGFCKPERLKIESASAFKICRISFQPLLSQRQVPVAKQGLDLDDKKKR